MLRICLQEVFSSPVVYLYRCVAALSANVLSKVRKNDSRQLRQCSGGVFANVENDNFSGCDIRTGYGMMPSL